MNNAFVLGVIRIRLNGSLRLKLVYLFGKPAILIPAIDKWYLNQQ